MTPIFNFETCLKKHIQVKHFAVQIPRDNLYINIKN